MSKINENNEVLMLLTTSAAFGALAYAVTLLGSENGSPSSLRIAGAMLLGVLLRLRPAFYWLAGYLLLAWFAWTSASALAGREFVLSAGFGFARVAEIAVAYGVLRVMRFDRESLSNISDYLRLLVVTLGLAPLVGVLIAMAFEWYLRGGDPVLTMFNWWTGNAVGMIIVLPAILSWNPLTPWRLMRTDVNAEALLWILLTLIVSFAALRYSDNAFVLMSLPMLVMAFRMNTLGYAVAALVMTMSVVVATRLWQPVSLGLQTGTGAPMSLQEAMFFALCSCMPAMLISIGETARARIASRLNQTAKQLRVVADNVPALIGYIDREHSYQFANRKYEEWLGLSAAEIIGMRQADVLGDHADSRFAELLRQAFAGQQQVFEAHSHGRDFEVHYIPDLKGEGGDGVFVMAHDISERKRAERSLYNEKERAQVTLNSIGDAVVACDPTMRITVFNPIAEDMTGWKLEEALGQPFSAVVKLIDLESGCAALSPMEIAIRENRIVALQCNSALQRRDGMRAAVEDSAAPIRDRDGGVIGGVMVFHDVSESRAMALKMSHMAQHDYLTDLPNRVLLHDRLSQASNVIAHGGCGALLFVDMDRFKRINDTLGHEVGDAVLKLVAHRLTEAVRHEDTVSRQGGDEFVLLLPHLVDPDGAARVAEKIIATIEQPIHIQGHVLHISASVGIAMFPQDASDPKTLIKQADTALFHAKQAGRGRFNYFAAAMSARVEQRMQIEQDMRMAMQNGDFFLAYQPKIQLPGGQVIGVEALVRWRRRDTGEVISPGVFISVAEESGLIATLDHWVMSEACRQNRAWQDAGLPPVPVSVNVSLARLDSQQLIRHIRSTLSATELSPQWLDIEFTETQMFSHPEEAQALIEQIREIGAQVTMDDFGTGFSSLSYLARYSFDALKIDQSFVRDLPENIKHMAIVKAIISMANALGYRVVAEGVETSAQADALLQLGCHEMQGYLYSRPIPEEAFATFLRQGCCA